MLTDAPVFRVKCPKCGAEPLARCRTTSGSGRTTDTHIARYDAKYPGFSDPEQPAEKANYQ